MSIDTKAGDTIVDERGAYDHHERSIMRQVAGITVIPPMRTVVPVQPMTLAEQVAQQIMQVIMERGDQITQEDVVAICQNHHIETEDIDLTRALVHIECDKGIRRVRHRVIMFLCGAVNDLGKVAT